MSNRFEVSNAKKIVEVLVASGEDPNATLGPPDTSLNGGCTVPEHCPQHPGVTIEGKPMLSVLTRVSNSRLSRLAKELGLAIVK